MIHRFTVKEYFHKFVHTFTHVDRGMIYLARELFLRPGIVAREYISGKRVKYFSPLQYLVILVAVSTFITLNFDLLGPKLDPAKFQTGDHQLKFQAGMSQFFYKYFNIILFVSVPLVAFFSWLFFRKSGFNFAENLVFVTFISAQRTLVFILLTPLLYFARDVWYIWIGIYYLFWLVYFIYAYVQFYGQGVAITIAKYIAVFLLTFAVMQSFAYLFVLFFVVGTG